MQTFWQSPRIADKPGLKAVDLFRAVGDGRIKALWIMATNPVDSMPEADARARGARGLPVRRRLGRRRATPTRRRMAHVLLPSLAWGEKDGTVTNSERRISRQRAFLPPPGEARPDWWQLAEVAQRMGFGDAFAWRCAGRDLRRARAPDRRSRTTARAISISAMSPALDRDAYDALEPFQWPQPARRATRFFADGGFFTPDRPRALRADAVSRAGDATRRRAIRSCSTPAASATSGTP